MEAKYPEITIGEAICDRLRHIYHNGTPWADCHADITRMFHAICSTAARFYADRSKADALKELLLYNDTDIMEILDHGQGITEKA